MAKKTVYVLTSTELGWDCVIGVFTTKKKLLDSLNDDLEEGGTKITEKNLNDNSYVIHQEELI